MKSKRSSLLACAVLLSFSSLLWAQFAVEDAEWKESELPPPPVFDMGKLLTFDVSLNSALVYGVDPASIGITKSDSLVRYVMVATSASGVRNVMYEAIRCSTGEFKTYARYSPEGRWNMVSNPQWRSMFGNSTSRYALRFAQAGACDNAAVPTSVNDVVSRLKNTNSRATH